MKKLHPAALAGDIIGFPQYHGAHLFRTYTMRSGLVLQTPVRKELKVGTNWHDQKYLETVEGLWEVCSHCCHALHALLLYWYSAWLLTSPLPYNTDCTLIWLKIARTEELNFPPHSVPQYSSKLFQTSLNPHQHYKKLAMSLNWVFGLFMLGLETDKPRQLRASYYLVFLSRAHNSTRHSWTHTEGTYAAFPSKEAAVPRSTIAKLL